MSALPIDPRTLSQAELERAYRDRVPAWPGLDAPAAALAAHEAAHDEAADAWMLSGGDPDKLAAHQASCERTRQPALDIIDPAAVSLAVHRAHERKRRHEKPVGPLPVLIKDAGGLTPVGVLIVEEHVAGIVHAAQALCDAIDDAAAELTEGRRRGSGMRRIQRALKRPGGRPRGAGPGTPAAALRALLRAGVQP